MAAVGMIAGTYWGRYRLEMISVGEQIQMSGVWDHLHLCRRRTGVVCLERGYQPPAYCRDCRDVRRAGPAGPPNPGGYPAAVDAISQMRPTDQCSVQANDPVGRSIVITVFDWAPDRCPLAASQSGQCVHLVPHRRVEDVVDTVVTS